MPNPYMNITRDLWVREERWIKHYSSSHHILLVGDGDFSFSMCLAWAFGSATNIVATSLDSCDELMMKYTNATSNVAYLQALGALVLHAVDATKMRSHPHLMFRKFDRIIYNFPHAGFFGKEDDPDLIGKHRDLVRGFLSNASSLLQLDGEIHVSHKITPPFDRWRIKDLAPECSVLFIGLDIFRIEDYPGYQNKRGSGPRPNEPFPLGKCGTFKYKLHPITQEVLKIRRNLEIPPSPPLTLQVNNTDACHRIFGGYLHHIEETFGSTGYDVRLSVIEALKDGFDMYMGEVPQRHSSGFIGVLEELRQLSVLRSERLRQMLLLLDDQGR